MGIGTWGIWETVALLDDYTARHLKSRTRTGKRKHIGKSHKQKLKELEQMLTMGRDKNEY